MAPAEQLCTQHHIASEIHGSERFKDGALKALNPARLRILHVIESCGGSGRHVLDLAKGQIQQAHDVTVIYSPIRAEKSFVAALDSVEGLRTWAVPMKRAVGLHDAISLRALDVLVRDSGPYDILHGHSSKAGALVRLLPRSIPGARIYTPHAFRTMDPQLPRHKRLVFGALEVALSRLSPGPILTGSDQETRAGRTIGLNERHLRRVPFAIDPGLLPSREAARSRLGISSCEPVVGFVGRFEHQKAPERLLRAFALIRNKSARLVMVGGGKNKENDLASVACALKITDRVKFTGPVRGVDIMPAFDIFVIPSRYESLGYVFLEGLAVGVPMVATDVGIASEIIESDKNGLLVENKDDPEIWASALENVLENSTLSRMKNEALIRKRSLDLSSMTRAVEHIYYESAMP